MLKRRRLIFNSLKAATGLLFWNPYSIALEQVNNLNLPTTPDPFQKKLIESNVDFLLAEEDWKPGDPCENIKAGPAKSKCRAEFGFG